jgi:hypothetical protein
VVLGGPVMTVDLRFRVDGAETRPTDPAAFFSTDLPAALSRNAASMQEALDWLALAPLTIHVDDEAWHLTADEAVRVVAGPARRGAAVRLTADQLADLATDQATFMGFFTHGTLDQTAGRLENLLDWWLVLRGALDDRAVHTPSELPFTGTDGTPLDLDRSFHLDEDPAELRHFLEEAGFLHLRDVFTQDEMDAISSDMDRLASDYAPDDGRSWWATTADGTQRLVRMQGFDSSSEATRTVLADRRFAAIGALPGDGHLFADYAQALIKPIGVVEGISDVPWHKDCSLGRHSYDCCSLTVGISVTGADATSGQLRVVAGSHRVLVWPTFMGKPTGLPEVDLPTNTGDVTVHLSCTKHMSQPPVDCERRVLYTGFRLPPFDAEAVATARKGLYRIMESIPDGVSQRPALAGTGKEER